MGNLHQTYGQKNSASSAIRQPRFGTYLQDTMESLRFGRKLLCILFLLVHFSEVPIRLAIEQIKMYVHRNTRGQNYE